MTIGRKPWGALFGGLAAVLAGCTMEAVEDLDALSAEEPGAVVEAIQGGTPITAGQINRFLPVHVQYLGPDFTAPCSGTLLRNDLVVTNEHCLFAGSGRTVDLLQMGHQQRSSGTLIHHPSNLPSSFGADVLIIRTAPFVVDGKNVGFRRLIWRGNSFDLRGKTVTVVGRGPADPFEVNQFVVHSVEEFTPAGPHGGGLISGRNMRAWIRPPAGATYQTEGGDSGAGVFLSEGGVDYLIGVNVGNKTAGRSEVLLLDFLTVQDYIKDEVNRTAVSVGCTGSENLYMGDFNGNGRGDLLCHNPSTGVRGLKISHESPVFSASWTQWLNAWCNHSGSRLFVGDFNGDGRDDLLCSDTAGRKWVDLGPTFSGTDSGWYWNANWCHTFDLHIADYDGDGRDDLLCRDPSDGRIWIDYAHNGFAGTDRSYNNGWCTYSGAKLHVGKFNGDARADLLCHDPTGRVLLDYAGVGGTFDGYPDFGRNNGWCTGAGKTVYIADLDGDRRDDLLCRQTSNGALDFDYNKDGFYGSNGSEARNWCTQPGWKWLPPIALDSNVMRNSAAENVCHLSNGLLLVDFR